MELEGLVITPAVLTKFNRRQKQGAVLGIVGGILLLVSTWFFFWGATRYVLYSFDGFLPTLSAWRIASLLTIIVVLSGFLRYRRGLGAIAYWDSVGSIFSRGETTGAVVVNHYASQITGSAFTVSQMMLASPRLIMEGAKRWHRCVAPTAANALEMEQIRLMLDSKITSYPLETFANQLGPLRDLGWIGIATLSPQEGKMMVRISLEAQSRRS